MASNNRSVFTFFSSDTHETAAPGSYGDFVAQAPIVTNNKLNLYTADRLCEFFADTLKSDNRELRDTVRDIIKDYENSVRALNLIAEANETAHLQFKGDVLIQRLLRLMLVHEIIGIQNRADNLQFGLYLTTDAERNVLKNRVKALVEKGVLYLVQETAVYEFKRSQSVDLDRKMETYLQDPANQPQNLVAELAALVPLEKQEVYLEAKDYNLPYSEDKRLLRRIVRAVDLGLEKGEDGEKVNYFQMLEGEVESETNQKGEYEGVALYVLCENPEDLSRAKSFCARNESDRIVVAIPKEPIHFLDAILDLRALLAIESSEDRETFTMQDNAALQARLNGDQHGPGARGKLKALQDKLINDARAITWHGKYAQIIPTDASKPYDAANRVMEALYSVKRSPFAHDDFNKLHIKIDRTRNVALKESVEELADYTESIVVDTEYAQQRGDIRYLQKCLLNNGALRQVKSNGSKLHCEFEGTPEKFSAKLPALADMVQEIRKLPNQGKIPLTDWVRRYRRPPYGQGPVALALSLACLRRLFGDSIRFKIDETNVGDMPARSFEEILSLSEGQYPNAFLSYRPLSAQEKALAKLVYGTFAPSGPASTKDYTVVEAHSALQTWWDQLPPLTKVADIYRDCEIPIIVPFIQAMQKVAARDAHSFLFDELPMAFGLDAGMATTRDSVDAMKAALPEVKNELTNALEGVERRIMESVRQLFGVEGNTYDDLLEGIKGWYNKLDSNQRDSHAPWNNHDSHPLVLCLKSITDLRETFLNRIPDSVDYNMRPVRDWMQDRVDEYVQRLLRGKEHIEKNQTKVEPAQVCPKGEHEWSPEGSLLFRDAVSLTFKPPVKGGKVFVAEGTTDPTDPAAQRTQFKGTEALEVNDHKTLRVAAQDAEGNWSPVQTIKLINANKEYEPAISGNVLGEKFATFKFPVDKGSLKVTCREIFKKSLEFGIIKVDDLRDCIEESLKELKLKK